MSDRSLAGLRVVVTRAEGQADVFVERLQALGADVIPFPTIAIAPPADTAPLDRAIAQLASYDWVIFTSVNGVDHFWRRAGAIDANLSVIANCSVAAIGPATAGALRERGVSPDLVPEEFVAEAVLDALPGVRGLRILLPRADIARRVLHEQLVARGAHVDEVVAYRTVPFRPLPEAFTHLRAGADVLTFTSPSTVRNFVRLLGRGLDDLLIDGTLVACIGPVTAQAAAELALPVHVVADEYTIEGLTGAIVAATGKIPANN